MEKLKLSKFEIAFYIMAFAAWGACFSTLVAPDVKRLLQYFGI